MTSTLSRQQRRWRSRQARKQARGANGAGDGATPPPVLVVSPKTYAIAQAVPTHDADCPLSRGGLQLVSSPGRWVGDRDTVCWHEAGHATLALALGWHVWSIELDPVVPPAGHPGAWTGLSRIAAAPTTDPLTRRAQYQAGAVIAAAGPIAERTVLAGLGLAVKRPEDAAVVGALLGPDQEAVDRARDVLSIPPQDADAFTQSVCDEALALLYQHRRQFGALVAALLTHQTLNGFEILHVWRHGGFPAHGRIGEMPRLSGDPGAIRRDGALGDPAFRAILRERFACAWASSAPGEPMAGWLRTREQERRDGVVT